MEIGPEKVEEILKFSREPISLETPVDEEEDSHPGDFLLQEYVREPIFEEMPIISKEISSLETPIGEEEDYFRPEDFIDRTAMSPGDAATFTLLKEQVGEVLHTLSEREARVLQLRFGLEDGRQRTLEEVGRTFGVTRERIRQIEAKALRKLRHPTRSKKLRDFLE